MVKTLENDRKIKAITKSRDLVIDFIFLLFSNVFTIFNITIFLK